MKIRYRDMLLNGYFTDDQRKEIVGMANAIVRWLSGRATEHYKGDARNQYIEEIEYWSNEIIQHDYNNGLGTIGLCIFFSMDAKHWCRDTDLWPYAMWESYWLMRNETAEGMALQLD